MKTKSEKACYSDELQRIAVRFNADLFVWGEELIDKKLIIYPKKLKGITGYDEIQDNLEPCGLVIIDTRKQKFLHCVSATVDVTNGNVYLSEAGFNSSWKLLKRSVNKGIKIANENDSSSIEQPEDILVFDHLQRTGSVPVIADDTIRYEEKKLTQEERYRNSRKQSLLDNQKMLYFYGSDSRYFHDKDCVDVKEILPEEFEASGEIPDKEICPKCQRRIYLRKACYPNTKQIGLCDKILRDQGVSLRKIKHCVMDLGMKFHATSMEEMLVESAEDRWIIKGLSNKYPKLWHNNYVKTGPEERYITEGFHNQKIENKSFSQLLTYIENYSFEKHLKSERQAAELEEKENVIQIEPDVVEKRKIQEEQKISNILQILLHKIKSLFRRYKWF